ncbi:MAG: threonine aldolase family protein [Acidimicrobiales bacterium]|jgi:threonine aldolase
MTPSSDDENALRSACTRFLVGHGNRPTSELLADIDPATEMDRYGEGGVVAELESEVSDVLGKPAAVFLPTGVMAQQATLRVHADRRARRTIVGHPACHLDWREGRGYERLHGLTFRQAGELRLPLTLEALESVAEPPAALLIELPQRDLGGFIPSWEDLLAQVDWGRQRGGAVHLDGARLWEAAAGYERSPAEVAALFDTVYVSFYKGLGAVGGCCVAGPADVVAEVREWRGRHGGTVFGLWPYAASCLTSLRRRLPRMAEYHRHAGAIADALRDLPGAEIVPDPPPTSHLHLHLHRREEELRAAALQLARDEKIWTFAHWFDCDTPSVQRIECPVGDATLGFSPEEVRRIVSYLLSHEG